MSLDRQDVIDISGNRDAETGKTFRNGDRKEFHHGAIHNTLANQARYPNFIKTVLCQYLLGVTKNDTHNPSFGRMPEYICEAYEKMLTALKTIRDSEYCRENELMMAVIYDVLEGSDGGIKSDK